MVEGTDPILTSPNRPNRLRTGKEHANLFPNKKRMKNGALLNGALLKRS